jgi:hypothetical protein
MFPDSSSDVIWAPALRDSTRAVGGTVRCELYLSFTLHPLVSFTFTDTSETFSNVYAPRGVLLSYSAF